MIEFPVVKYCINGVKTMPMHTATVIPSSIGSDRAVNAGSFEIKANHVTLFGRKFVVTKKRVTNSRTIQIWKFEFLEVREKLDLLNNLKKSENSERWTFPD
jgi:hypothetical protein